MKPHDAIDIWLLIDDKQKDQRLTKQFYFSALFQGRFYLNNIVQMICNRKALKCIIVNILPLYHIFISE